MGKQFSREFVFEEHLVNIVDAVLSELDEVSISLEIATDLDIPVLQKTLPGNVLQTLNSLMTATPEVL